jgi:hypothetical protein
LTPRCGLPRIATVNDSHVYALSTTDEFVPEWTCYAALIATWEARVMTHPARFSITIGKGSENGVEEAWRALDSWQQKVSTTEVQDTKRTVLPSVVMEWLQRNALPRLAQRMMYETESRVLRSWLLGLRARSAARSQTISTDQLANMPLGFLKSLLVGVEGRDVSVALGVIDAALAQRSDWTTMGSIAQRRVQEKELLKIPTRALWARCLFCNEQKPSVSTTASWLVYMALTPSERSRLMTMRVVVCEKGKLPIPIVDLLKHWHELKASWRRE